MTGRSVPCCSLTSLRWPTATDLASAQQQRELAQQQLAAADNALVLVAARRAALHDSVMILRAGLSTFSSVPSDVLSIIFEDVCRERNPPLVEPFADLQIDRLAGLAPYRLATVCKHWRSTALSTPAMWTYIGLAKMYNDYEPFLRNYCGHLTTLLARSRTCSLEIDLVLWASIRVQINASTQYLSERFIERVFNLLVTNASRIRALTVCQRYAIPESRPTPSPQTNFRDGLLRSTLELLCCPTLRLTELRLDIDGDWDSDATPPRPDLGFWKNYPTQPFPTFLPHAPRLQRLTASDAPLLFERSHPGLPALRHLELMVREVHISLLYDTFVAAPNLDDIYISVDQYLDLGGVNPQPIAPLRMSRMRFDRSSESPPVVLASPVIQLPNLTTLDLYDGLLDDIHGQVLASLARTLTTLVYRSDVRNAEDLAVLRRFVSLTSMTLNGEDFGGEDYKSRDYFFARSATRMIPCGPSCVNSRLYAGSHSVRSRMACCVSRKLGTSALPALPRTEKVRVCLSRSRGSNLTLPRSLPGWPFASRPSSATSASSRGSRLSGPL